MKISTGFFFLAQKIKYGYQKNVIELPSEQNSTLFSDTSINIRTLLQTLVLITAKKIK